MDLQYLLIVFKARWRMLAACTVICSLAGLAAGLFMTTQHRATSTVLVRTSDGDPSRGARGGAVTSTATALELMESPRVARQVIALSGITLDHPDARRWGEPKSADADPVDWLADKLVKSTRFTTTPESNVITVEAVSRDGKTAARIANGFVQAYLETSRELQAAQAKLRLQQLQEGLPRAEADVRTAQAAMSRFRAAHPDFNVDGRGSESAAVLASTLAGQLARIETERAASASGAPPGESESPSTAVQSLQADVRRAKARFVSVSDHYGANHPLYQSAASDLRAAEASLRAAVGAAGRASGSEAAHLRDAISREQQRAAASASLQEDYSAFRRTLVAAETAANAMRDSIRQAQMESESAFGGGSIVAYAVPDATDATHPLTKTLPLGLVFGLLAGSIGLLVAENLAPRVRRGVAAMGTVGARVLARIPSARAATPARKSPDPGCKPALRVARKGFERPESSPSSSLVAPGMAGRVLVDPRTGPTANAPDVQRESAPGIRRTTVPEGVLTEHDRARELRDSEFGLHRLQHSDAQNAFIVDLCPDHPVAEAIRGLRSQLLLEWRSSERKRALSIQSAGTGDGKSFIATNLAIACAQANMRTVLVDLNLRAPHLDELFDVQAVGGVSTILAGDESTAAVHQVDSQGRLSLLPAGPRPRNPQELVSGKPLESMLAYLERSFDVVILDSPSWDSGADAQLIAAAATDVVVVARNDRTPLKRLQEMQEAFERMNVRTMGVVVNEH